MHKTVSKPTYKTLFHFLTFYGLIFSCSKGRSTLHYLFSCKSARCIRILHLISVICSLAFLVFIINWTLVLQVFPAERFRESWKNTKVNTTITSSILQRAGIGTLHFFGSISIFLSIYQALNQDIGTVNEKIRSSPNFSSQLPGNRCLVSLIFTIMITFLEVTYVVWITEVVYTAAGSSGMFRNGVKIGFLNISTITWKRINPGIETVKILINLHRQLHLVLSVQYANQMILNLRKSSRRPFKNGFRCNFRALIDELKRVEDVIESINQAHGLYILIYFPSAIIYIIVAICAQFIQAFPSVHGTMFLHLLPGIWFTFKTITIAELGHTLKVTIRKNRTRLLYDIHYSKHEDFADAFYTKMMLEWNWNWKLNAAGFFDVNRKMLTSITAATGTYLVVMLQFYVTDLSTA